MGKGNRFTDKEWKRLTGIIAAAFGFDTAKAARFSASSTAKLVGALPFLAGCREPERTAIAHLGTLVLASHPSAKGIFDHNEGDDFDTLARLAPIAHFEGGDPAVINRGMKLLASMMIRGYKKDIASDKKAGLYNPLAAKKWDASAKLGALASSVSSSANDEMDAIVASAQDGIWGWWD
jgi:hypothetical protein